MYLKSHEPIFSRPKGAFPLISIKALYECPICHNLHEETILIIRVLSPNFPEFIKDKTPIELLCERKECSHCGVVSVVPMEERGKLENDLKILTNEEFLRENTKQFFSD